MGELWVLLEFDNTKVKELFWDNVGMGSWYWVDVEAIPFKFWSGKIFKKIATKWGELLDVDDHDEMSFHSKRICIHTKICSNIWLQNFKLIFKGIHQQVKQSDLGLHIDGEDNGASETFIDYFYLKYPPGFIPSVEKNGSKSKDDQVQNISDNQLNGDNESVHQVERKDNRNSDGAKTNSTGLRKFKMSEIPRTGGSILSVMEEIVKVGITMGYNMDGVNFDYVYSDSIGNSGGILCIWDPNSFRKDSVTVSDYFVIVRGVWIKSGMDILIVVVYAPHDVRDKRLLWDYLSHVSNQWAGDQNAHIDMPFPNSLSTDQQKDLECMLEVPQGENPELKYADLQNQFQSNSLEILGKLQQVNKAQASEVAQKAKIKWFDKPPDQNAHIDMPFPNSLSTDQQKDLECMVSKEEEVKKLQNQCQTYLIIFGSDRNGDNTSFWKDKWHNEGVLKDVFPQVVWKNFNSTISPVGFARINSLSICFVVEQVWINVRKQILFEKELLLHRRGNF
ncbi:RNA-directed DNA polymerase, eukaryota, reverse transcriptase zinc-binding domain protein [Tanacetum coccineum]